MAHFGASVRCLKFEDINTLLHDFTILGVRWLCYISYYLTNLGLWDGSYQSLFLSFQTCSPKLYCYSKELALICCELICPSLLLHFCSSYFCCISHPIVIVSISTQSDDCAICIITFLHSQPETNSVMIYEIWGKSKRQIFLHLPEYYYSVSRRIS